MGRREYLLAPCQQCATVLYETNGMAVRSPGWTAGAARRPVDVTIGGQRHIMFCSSDCASKWFAKQTTESLLYGYRLF